MRGLRTWRGSVMALCVAVALAGLTASSTLANEPKPETASAPPRQRKAPTNRTLSNSAPEPPLATATCTLFTAS